MATMGNIEVKLSDALADLLATKVHECSMTDCVNWDWGCKLKVITIDTTGRCRNLKIREIKPDEHE